MVKRVLLERKVERRVWQREWTEQTLSLGLLQPFLPSFASSSLFSPSFPSCAPFSLFFCPFCPFSPVLLWREQLQLPRLRLAGVPPDLRRVCAGLWVLWAF